MDWLVAIELGWGTAAAHVAAGYAALLGWVIREDELSELVDDDLGPSNKPYVGLQTPDADGPSTR